MRIRSLVVAALALSLTIATAAPARAWVSGRYVSSVTVNVPANGFLDNWSTCPSGGLNTGGGHFFGSTTGIWLDASFPTTGPNTGWNVIAHNKTPYAQPFTIYGVCANVAGRQQAAVHLELQAGQSGILGVACPPGTRATGGGWRASWFVGGLLVHGSRPIASGWEVTLTNTSPQGRYISIYAACAAITPTVVRSSFTVAPGQGWDTVATCPAGQVSLGGGWLDSWVAPGLVIDISRPSTFSQGWHVHAYNVSNASRTITAYATCA